MLEKKREKCHDTTEGKREREKNIPYEMSILISVCCGASPSKVFALTQSSQCIMGDKGQASTGHRTQLQKGGK